MCWSILIGMLGIKSEFWPWPFLRESNLYIAWFQCCLFVQPATGQVDGQEFDREKSWSLRSMQKIVQSVTFLPTHSDKQAKLWIKKKTTYNGSYFLMWHLSFILLPREHAAGIFPAFSVHINGIENQNAMWDKYWPVGGNLGQKLCCMFTLLSQKMELDSKPEFRLVLHSDSWEKSLMFTNKQTGRMIVKSNLP